MPPPPLAVYCPPDQKRLSRPELLQDMARRLGARGDFASGIRDRARGRPPRAKEWAPAKRSGACRSDNPDQANAAVGTARVAGRLLPGVWAAPVYKEGELEEGDVQEATGPRPRSATTGSSARREGASTRLVHAHGTSEQRARSFEEGRDNGSSADSTPSPRRNFEREHAPRRRRPARARARRRGPRAAGLDTHRARGGRRAEWEVAQIVKSLVFRALAQRDSVLVLASGADRVDEGAGRGGRGADRQGRTGFVRARTGLRSAAFRRRSRAADRDVRRGRCSRSTRCGQRRAHRARVRPGVAGRAGARYRRAHCGCCGGLIRRRPRGLRVRAHDHGFRDGSIWSAGIHALCMVAQSVRLTAA